jgi:hypothetical protein
MFLLVIRAHDGELHYWRGGQLWSVHPEEAVRFIQEADADATINLLKKYGESNPTMHVVPMPGGID